MIQERFARAEVLHCRIRYLTFTKKSARRIEFLRQTFLYEQDDKPGSVANGHLSRPAVAGRLQRLTRKQTGRLMLSVSLASDGVYMCPGRYRPGGSLLHCPSNLTVRNGRRYISVALALESPPPDVIRHPAL